VVAYTSIYSSAAKKKTLRAIAYQRYAHVSQHFISAAVNSVFIPDTVLQNPPYILDMQ